MNILIVLVPAALLLGVLGLVAFFWCLRARQFDDPEGAARRILDPAVEGREPANRRDSRGLSRRSPTDRSRPGGGG